MLHKRLLALLTLSAFLLWGPAATLLQAASQDSAVVAEDAPQDSSDEEGGMDLLLPAAPALSAPAEDHAFQHELSLPDAFVAAPDDPPNR